jgi:hypothetical protein
VKRSEVAKKKRSDSLPAVKRFIHSFAASHEIVGIKLVEDLQIFFVASADVGMDNGSVEGALRISRLYVRIGMKLIV